MHGDIIRRLEQNKDIIGHIHTAGNPGRAVLHRGDAARQHGDQFEHRRHYLDPASGENGLAVL